jgi:hypothetical protein
MTIYELTEYILEHLCFRTPEEIRSYIEKQAVVMDYWADCDGDTERKWRKEYEREMTDAEISAFCKLDFDQVKASHDNSYTLVHELHEELEETGQIYDDSDDEYDELNGLDMDEESPE